MSPSLTAPPANTAGPPSKHTGSRAQVQRRGGLALIAGTRASRRAPWICIAPSASGQPFRNKRAPFPFIYSASPRCVAARRGVRVSRALQAVCAASARGGRRGRRPAHPAHESGPRAHVDAHRRRCPLGHLQSHVSLGPAISTTKRTLYMHLHRVAAMCGGAARRSREPRSAGIGPLQAGCAGIRERRQPTGCRPELHRKQESDRGREDGASMPAGRTPRRLSTRR